MVTTETMRHDRRTMAIATTETIGIRMVTASIEATTLEDVAVEDNAKVKVTATSSSDVSFPEYR